MLLHERYERMFLILGVLQANIEFALDALRGETTMSNDEVADFIEKQLNEINEKYPWINEEVNQ